MDDKIILCLRIYKSLCCHTTYCFFSIKEAQEHVSGDEQLIFGLDYSDYYLDYLVDRSINYLLTKYKKEIVLNLFEELVTIGFTACRDYYYEWQLCLIHKKKFRWDFDFESEWDMFDEVLESLNQILSEDEISNIMNTFSLIGLEIAQKMTYDDLFILGEN